MYLICLRFKLQNNVIYLQTESTYNGYLPYGRYLAALLLIVI